MLSTLAVTLTLLGSMPDTALVLGSREIDMTGDGRPETLVLLGIGPSLDSLDLTFQIIADDRIVFAAAMRPLTRRIVADGQPRFRTPSEQLDYVAEYGRSFFADSRFVPAPRFLESYNRGTNPPSRRIPDVIARHRVAYRANPLGGLDLGPAADTTGAGSVLQEILAGGRPVFRISIGYDNTTEIAWSRLDQRFYRLIACW
jgi:hypothetical protein